MEGNLLYSNSFDLMLILSKNTFTATIRLVFDQISGYCGLAKLIHKINNQRGIITIDYLSFGMQSQTNAMLCSFGSKAISTYN